MSKLRAFLRTTLVLTLTFWLGLFSASKFDSVLNTPPALVSSATAPAFPQTIALAVCAKDVDYLMAHLSPGLEATPENLKEDIDAIFDKCTSVDFLGSYATAVDGANDYVFVLHYDHGSQFWVFTVFGGVVVKIQ